MNDQDNMSPIKFSSPTEVFSNENYLEDTESKRTITNFIQECKEVTKTSKNQLNQLKGDGSKRLNDAQESTNGDNSVSEI